MKYFLLSKKRNVNIIVSHNNKILSVSKIYNAIYFNFSNHLREIIIIIFFTKYVNVLIKLRVLLF